MDTAKPTTTTVGWAVHHDHETGAVTIRDGDREVARVADISDALAIVNAMIHGLTPPPHVTTWRVEERPHGPKRWQITRRDRGPGYTGLLTWRFADRYQAERYAADVLGVPRDTIDLD